MDFVSWTLLQRSANAIFPKASLGLVLIYVVFYLKRGGFETAPLEITLAGSLLLLISVAGINAAIPRLVARFTDEYQYETYLQTLVEKSYLSIAHCAGPLDESCATKSEAKQIDYRFDENFGYSVGDLKASLGELGLVTFIARITFLRSNFARPILRWILFSGVALGIIMMYSRPLSMIYEIYFKTTNLR